jgi:hypothetical protein
MLRILRHRVESLKVVDEEGVRDNFLRVTPVMARNGIESASDKNATISTRNGEDVTHLGGGIFETISGIRWRLAQ